MSFGLYWVCKARSLKVAFEGWFGAVVSMAMWLFWGGCSNSWVKLMNAAHTKYLTVIQICFQKSFQSTPSHFGVLANTHCKVKYIYIKSSVLRSVLWSCHCASYHNTLSLPVWATGVKWTKKEGVNMGVLQSYSMLILHKPTGGCVFLLSFPVI